MTVVYKPDYSDQTTIFDPRQNGHTVTVIGCGGIGASILPTLVTMGFGQYELWDDDVVEPRNVASQLAFRPEDVNRPKVEVMEEYLRAYGAEEVTTHRERITFDNVDQLNGIVIAAVDSMAARRMIWNGIAWRGDIPLYLDGRIGGETWQLFMLAPYDAEKIEWYETFWMFDDDVASPLPCAERAIVYPAVALGAVMAAQLARYLRGEEYPRMMQMGMRDLSQTIIN